MRVIEFNDFYGSARHLEDAADSGIVSLSHVPAIALRKRRELRMKSKPYLIRSLN